MKELVDKNPNIDVDKLTLEFAIKTHNYIHYSSIWRYVTHDLNYSLIALSRQVREYCEIIDVQFLTPLIFYYKIV